MAAIEGVDEVDSAQLDTALRLQVADDALEGGGAAGATTPRMGPARHPANLRPGRVTGGNVSALGVDSVQLHLPRAVEEEVGVPAGRVRGRLRGLCAAGCGAVHLPLPKRQTTLITVQNTVKGEGWDKRK